MVVKVKEKCEKTRHTKNNDKFRKYIIRGQRNIRYHDRILSNKKKSNTLIYFYNFTTRQCAKRHMTLVAKDPSRYPTPTIQHQKN